MRNSAVGHYHNKIDYQPLEETMVGPGSVYGGAHVRSSMPQEPRFKYRDKNLDNL